MSKRCVRVGLFGWGNVGTGVSRILLERAHLITEKTGFQLELVRIGVRRLPVSRPGISFDPSRVSDHPESILNDPDIDIVVETIGGIEPAKSYILQALQQGKHVVTANKALLAECGEELFAAAYRNGVNIHFEASVAGGIPIIKALREGLPANEIQTIYGIINGTANYILTQMTEHGTEFEDALAMAQELGYAETDPTFDVDGHDTAHKIVLLSSLAFGVPIQLEHIYLEGIRHITPKDIQYARELGFMIKLLAIAKRDAKRVQIRVHPTMIPERSMLANVHDVFNAVCIVGDAVGTTMFYGRGAGQMPTASAVVADLLDAAQLIEGGGPVPPPYGWNGHCNHDIQIESISKSRSRYYLRHIVEDRPGVLAQISGILGAHQISIATVIQKERHSENSVHLVLMTHEADEDSIQTALRQIDGLEMVREDTTLIRVEMIE